MPDPIGAPQVEQQAEDHQQVAQEGRQHRRPCDGPEALQVEDVDGGGDGESAGREGHADQQVEADPDAPGELIRQVGGRPESLAEADHGGIEPGQHDDDGEQPPEAEQRHDADHDRRSSSGASAAAVAGFSPDGGGAVAPLSCASNR